jgi:parvulin-like peptidyl-prolyl isomerase
MSRTILMSVFALALAGCPKDQSQEEGKTSTATTESPTTTETPKPETPKVAPPPSRPQIFAGAHILIGYKGAMRSKAGRTKDEALKLATELATKAKKDTSKFGDLAKKHSEGPSGPRGGDLGAWPKGRMVPAFDQAIEKMKIGEVSDPVESPFGYHVILRKEPPPPPPIHAGAHILIAYKGAMRARPNVTRSKDEALKLAKKLAAEAAKDPSKFAELAKKNSDGPSGPRGGSLGKWPKGRMVPEFDQAIEKMKMDEVTKEPVETPFGYHIIIRRDPASMP